jgi:hypothetical protein
MTNDESSPSLFHTRQIRQRAIITTPSHDNDLGALLTDVASAGNAAEVVVTGEDALHGLGTVAGEVE